MTHRTLVLWHELLASRDLGLLDDILAPDVVMISPVVHTPQRGREITKKYLTAALDVLTNEHFKYVRQVVDAEGAILEFETEIEGISLNGVDMVKWNDQGQITEFKVMVRPLKAINILHQKMGEKLIALG